ncbi:hypothetical protein LUZ60_006255 [Juncus effusus]|nr:hypothetical protein LUZ60_006255 [Juncus effusus]
MHPSILPNIYRTISSFLSSLHSLHCLIHFISSSLFLFHFHFSVLHSLCDYTMLARGDKSQIAGKMRATKLRSDIPRRRRIPRFSISGGSEAAMRSSSSTSCVQSDVTTLDSSTNHRPVTRSLVRKQSELYPAFNAGGHDAKRLKKEEASESGSCLESVAETIAPVQIADSYGDWDSDSSGLWIWSDGEISDSSEDDAVPSAMYSMILQFKRQFTPYDVAGADLEASPAASQDPCEEIKARVFEEEENEVSYRRLRSRERREMAVISHDNTKHLNLKIELRRLIFDQRFHMIKWMVEYFKETNMELETLFLGVSLLDRFLTRGYFKTVKHLQLLGISCITLATRIEENQPYNCIMEEGFYVDKNKYDRTEVVAMEWLVQEVLNYKCFVPTIHNFLWFYLKAVKADEIIDELARYLAVVALLDHERLSFKASTMAACLVILACLAAGRDDSCHIVMETHVRTRNDDLPECLKSLEWLIKHAC